MFSAAPLRRLSPTTKKFSDVSGRRGRGARGRRPSRRGPPTPAAWAPPGRRGSGTRQRLVASSRSTCARTSRGSRRVADHHRHAHARRRDAEVREAEDLARLVAELDLLVGVALLADAPSIGTTLNASVFAWTRARPCASRPRPSVRARPCPPTSAGTWAASSSMPFWPAPPAAWKLVATISRQPEDVVQRLERQHHDHRRAVRVGDDPLRASSRASGLTSETTSGTSASIRQARGVVDDDGPAGGEPLGPRASRCEPPAENRAMSKPPTVSSAQRLDGQAVEDLARPSARRRTGRPRRPGTRACAAGAHDRADRAGGADDREPHDVASLGNRPYAEDPQGLTTGTPRTAAPGGSCPSPESSNAPCSARTAPRHVLARDHAGDPDRRRRDHLDVDALVAEDGEHLGGDARMRLHAGADDRHLAHRLVAADDPMPSSATSGSSAA